MTAATIKEQALFETSKRLLAQAIVEGLVKGSIEPEQPHQLRLSSRKHAAPKDNPYLQVRIRPQSSIYDLGGDRAHVISFVRPEMLAQDIIIVKDGVQTACLDPGTLFREICNSLLAFEPGPGLVEKIAEELQSCAQNTEAWLELSSKQALPSLASPMIEWEQVLITGHPTHPFHRLCLAQTPMVEITSADIPQLLTPSIAFVAVPKACMRVTGPFQQLLKPLLDRLEVPSVADDKIIIPCHGLQLPCVTRHFPDAITVKSVDCADAQAALRTVTLKPELKYDHHLKLSFSALISGEVRVLRQEHLTGGQVAEQLYHLVPDDLWILREVASVIGGQQEPLIASQLTCIIRTDLEARARAAGEALIMAGSLTQKPFGYDVTHAERICNLTSLAQKRDWFKLYVRRLLQLVMPPLLNYGFAFEVHAQNTLARVRIDTGEVVGFVHRGLAGVDIHLPTLKDQAGIDLSQQHGWWWNKNLPELWGRVHWFLVQNHVAGLLYALDLDAQGGWSLVRDELYEVLRPDKDVKAKAMYDFFTAKTISTRNFLSQRMLGIYNDFVAGLHYTKVPSVNNHKYLHRESHIPNPLAIGMEATGSV